MTTNNGKLDNLSPDLEGPGRTPPHEHESYSRQNAYLMQ